MEHLSNIIKAIFVQQEGDRVLCRARLLRNEQNLEEAVSFNLDTDLVESEAMELLRKSNLYSTIDQQSIVCQVLLSKWMMEDKYCGQLQYVPHKSVFNALLHFGQHTLSIKDGAPVCQYHRLLRWHDLTTQLGEDIISTAFLASRDVRIHRGRRLFDWEAFIRHDNKELNAVLYRQPLADLHMHLKGSSFNFDLSWLSIVNHIGEMTSVFNDLSESQAMKWNGIENLYEKLYRAAAIRLFLASELGLIHQTFTSATLDRWLNGLIYVNGADYAKQSKDFGQSILSLQGALNTLKKDGSNQNETSELDYISIDHYDKETVMQVLAHERKFMYTVFRHIFDPQNKENRLIPTLFYAYICYKEAFRQVVVQLNSTVGFANFAHFEGLKDKFILPNYQGQLKKCAIESFLCVNEDRYLETRITPEEDEKTLTDKLCKISEVVGDEYKDRYAYILHFIKERDARDVRQYRHQTLRAKIKRQAVALYNFRDNKENWGRDPIVGKVVGIDAANSEIYCRPEVFAQAFRFLRWHPLHADGVDRCPYDLNVTYHVGEDFFDIADGLRAIDEAMIFLGLRHGDRMGHCLALGTNVRQYYEKRNHTICSTKQVFLDNMAWLYHKCHRLNGPQSLLHYLEYMFHKYFIEIYRSDDVMYMENHYNGLFVGDTELRTLDNIQDYYLSWLLRGNSPSFGQDLDQPTNDPIEKAWQAVAVNNHPGVLHAVNNPNALELFDAYHSDRVVINGSDAETFTITKEYRGQYYDLLEAIQEQLLTKIEHKRIAIECNPSSNYKIGEMEKYDQHPILRFFNYGLTTPYKRHDIAVSINTDDQGVFSTSLEREYSLMALALEINHSNGFDNSPRQVIEWLDKIRAMSVEQAFSRLN